MNEKIALILCFVLMFSALTSCQKPTEANNSSVTDSSENEVTSTESVTDESSTDESQDTVTQIPENVIYFTGEYYFYRQENILHFDAGLNEWFSYGHTSKGLTDVIENNDYDDSTYYYVGIVLRKDGLPNTDESKKNDEKALKQVGFIPTDEQYLNAEYVRSFVESYDTITSDDFDDFTAYAQNLMPDVDLSKYPVEDGAYYFLTDFAYDRTGYITIDGLLALVDEYNAIGVTWLPAPDDRSRFLTYVAPYASKKWD